MASVDEEYGEFTLKYALMFKGVPRRDWTWTNSLVLALEALKAARAEWPDTPWRLVVIGSVPKPVEKA